MLLPSSYARKMPILGWSQFLLATFLLISSAYPGWAIVSPEGLVTRSGDRSIVLHWNQITDTSLGGYRVYRSSSADGPFTAVSSLLSASSFCEPVAINGVTNYYRITAVTRNSEESAPSPTIPAAARAFANNDEFITYLQQTGFDYFWYAANPLNGLIPDRSMPGAACSIAAVGFGLTALGIGIDHGWITRPQGRERVLTTLNTFRNMPQGPTPLAFIGYRGWFYHFLDMKTALPPSANIELSSIDTVLLLAGIIYAREYFDQPDPIETSIREAADAIINRVDWNWMARDTNVVSMGWFPSTGFIGANWVGYNEASILYILGLGAATNPLPATAWQRWTNGYTWQTLFGQSFVPFPPLFGHQYSQCWLDLRHMADDYMNSKASTYFENSRRATLAQRAYCIANPLNRLGYGANIWGLTASDGPSGYSARGAPPTENDDGTIVPTAIGGSVAFAPEICLPSLRYIYDRFRPWIWTPYGFRDAFNLGQDWWGPDVLGIDQGPIVIMIENYRSQSVWKTFMRHPQVLRGLNRAGFKPLPFMSTQIRLDEDNQPLLSWNSSPGRVYQVENSPNLMHWYSPTNGRLAALDAFIFWSNTATLSWDSQFYRVFQFGTP